MSNGKRLTIKNPNGTYRIPIERMETLRIETSGYNVGVFGDLVNRLGELEDNELNGQQRKA